MNPMNGTVLANNPIDEVENFLNLRSYATERRGSNEVVVAVQGKWNDMLIFFSFEENIAMIERLLESGVTPQPMQHATQGGVFEGMTFVLTGTLPTLTRALAEEIILSCGGKTSGSVSKKTSVVLAGESAGSKLEKAQKLGVEIIDEAEFLKRAQQTGA